MSQSTSAPAPFDLPALLAANAYPGRGLMLGRTADGRQAVVYFIMGRSENSRNRVFRRDGDALTITRFTADAQGDPSLILYNPVRVLGDTTIAANGDQTDTIHAALARGGSFEAALFTRTFEPDSPHFTPRISGFTNARGYALSILKAGNAAIGACQRQFFHYEPQNGVGHFIHTYAQDGAPLPSFAGEPAAVRVPDDIDDFTRALWESLNKDNRIALYVRFIEADGRFTDHIINRHEEGRLQ
ncbi:MAG: IMP cyclohydrolase [Clostridia bacterium]|nr:IMP cyclohydrolase [Clostridia bacterium]